MKIGVNRWAIPSEWDLPRTFNAVKKAGFDSIELNTADEGEISLKSTSLDAQRIRKQAADAGVEISSLLCTALGPYPMTANEESTRAKGVQGLLKHIELGEALGVGTLLVVPGGVSSNVQYDQAYYRAQDCIKSTITAAAEANVVIAIENVWNKFLLSPLEMKQFIEECASPNVGCYFDVGNVLVTGFPQHWIRILGKHIAGVHLKNYHTSIGNIQGFSDNLLHGDVPWAEVRKAFDDIGYNGYVTAELTGYRAHTELSLKHICETARTIFD